MKNADLPRPRKERWQPLRSGLVNLYRYDYEEFWYEDGHLLLRGNNGTGKSRVLALQLPFLLDGDVAPHRLEPDGDLSKKVEWNLLLGNKYPDRLGYTWLEFGRIDAEGREWFITLGCGLHAAEHRGLVGKWFFVTDQRIGRELALLTPQRIPLTKERLGESIGNRGAIYTTAGEYRKAVDRALFQLGDRYYPLVNLLVQLRQPQLSRHLDEKRLSDVLSEALPPLSEPIIADVAESFRSLDDDRSVLSSLRAAGTGVDAFLKEYGRYLQIAAFRRAASVRSEQTAYDSAREILRETSVLLAATEEHLRVKNTEIDGLELQEQSLTAALKTLSDSPEMQNARTLDRAQQQAADRKKDATTAEADLANAQTRRTELQRQAASMQATCAETLNQVEQYAATALVRSSEVAIDSKLASAMEAAYQQRWNDKGFHAATLKKWEDAIEARFSASRHLRGLNDEVRKAKDALDRASSEKVAAEDQVSSAAERKHSAYETHRRETELLVEACQSWINTLVELQPHSPDEILDAFRDWCDRAEGASPVHLAAAGAFAEATKRLSEEIVSLHAAASNEARAIEELEEEQRSLLDGIHAPPPPPHTRADGARDSKEGAPFWLLVDFVDGVPPAARAGIEAALESAGFLDAWVMPDGKLLDAAHDTVLIPALREEARGASLDGVLKPSIDRTDPRAAVVGENVVQAILRCISVGKETGPIWVDLDGTWQTGPMHGSWTKVEAQHIGQSAREASRRKRLSEIESELSHHKDLLNNLQAEKAAVERREHAAASESQRLPDDSGVRNAVAAMAQAALALDEARERLAEAEARVAQRRSEHKELSDRRYSTALDLKLDAWVEDLAGFESKVHELRNALSGFWPSLQSYAGALRGRANIEAMLTAAATEEDRRTDSLRQARQAAAIAEAEFKTLDSSVGASVKEILQKIEQARRGLETVLERLKEDRGRSGDLRVEAAKYAKDVERMSRDFDAAAIARDSACQKLQKLAAARLLQIAIPDLPGMESEWSATRALEVARTVANRLRDLDASDAAWTSSEKDIHHHIQILIETLQPHGHRPWYCPEDGVVSVIVNVQGKEWTMADLRNDLEVQIRDRQRILDEREIEILERHLIGEVSSHLHDLLHQAMDLVERMNVEIESRPMSTGMALRFKWEVGEEAPSGLDEVRRLLLRRDGTWSAGDRRLLGQFLQEQIKSVREHHEAGTWADHLKLALDYRTWHRFVVERQQDSRWQRLTRRTHGTGSGGEKAVALTIPQFAAAAAHYQSASPAAPRLILLDEAFVGIDNDMRSKCMGLLAAFDLDFIMTSEREWGCYPTLPGLAIYQLSARQGIDAVGVTRWVWNGRQRIRAEKPAFDSSVAITQAHT